MLPDSADALTDHVGMVDKDAAANKIQVPRCVCGCVRGFPGSVCTAPSATSATSA